MKTLKWTGSKGNEIELRARCEIGSVDEVLDADGYKIDTGRKAQIVDAMLELWVDGKMIDSCWDINFWQIIDLPNGLKKVWGLKVGMTPEQAEIVERFLRDVIEAGKSTEVAVTAQAAAAGDTLEETAAQVAASERIALAEQDKRNRRHPGYCTKCHSYCYGDCESND